MRLFVTGATGQLGRRLVLDRLERGDQVIVLSRDAARAAALFAADVNPNVTVVAGDPGSPGEWRAAVDGCHALVHLAGAGIADRRWTAAYKKLLVDSRVDSTYQVRCAVRDAARPPRVLICASAAGYYGDTGDVETDESGPRGADFLADLCGRWEEQALRAASERTRVVVLRIGMILDERGGALARMLPLFRFGLGGPLGAGSQYVSWIHWRDLLGLIEFVIGRPESSGIYNATSPGPVTSRQFARALGRCMKRPAFLPAPRLGLRLVMGELADYVVKGSRVVPRRARDEGYRFLFPDIEEALTALVPRAAAERPPGPSGPPSPSSPTATPAAPTPAEGRANEAASATTAAPAPVKLAAPSEPVRLVAIGVDGTLLRSDGRLAQGVVQACRAVERAGCVIVLATSRPPRGLHSILHALDLTSPSINYNGAAIWNPLDDRPQHHLRLDGVLARTIVEEIRSLRPGILVGLELLDRWYTDRVDPKFARETGLVMEPDYVGPLESHFAAELTRVDFVGPPPDIEEIAVALRDRYWRPRSIALFRSDPHIVQVTHPLVDKGIALQRIARAMGVSKAQVMAIGDGENDLGMLEWAGFAVAVANAVPRALALADQVVPSNDDHGVARALQRFVLSRPLAEAG